MREKRKSHNEDGSSDEMMNPHHHHHHYYTQNINFMLHCIRVANMKIFSCSIVSLQKLQ